MDDREFRHLIGYREHLVDTDKQKAMSSKLLEEPVNSSMITAMLKVLAFDITEDDVLDILKDKDTPAIVSHCSEIGLLCYGAEESVRKMSSFLDGRCSLHSNTYRISHLFLTHYMDPSFYCDGNAQKGAYRARNSNGSFDSSVIDNISYQLKKVFYLHRLNKAGNVIDTIAECVCRLHQINAFPKYTESVNILFVNAFLVSAGIPPIIMDDEFVRDYIKYTKVYDMVSDYGPLADVIEKALHKSTIVKA